MDLNAIAEFVKAHLLEHWPFVVLSLTLGMLTHYFKARVWTKEVAARIIDPAWPKTARFVIRVARIGRATLPLHAPVVGTVVGVLGVLLLGADKMPRSPGIDGSAYVVLYYLGAGIMSSWVFAAFKRLMKSKGIESEVDP